jgi:hypothetical protein
VSLAHFLQSILKLRESLLREITWLVAQIWDMFAMSNSVMAWTFIDRLLDKFMIRSLLREQMLYMLSKLGIPFIMVMSYCWRIPVNNCWSLAIETLFFCCILLVDGLRMMMFLLDQEWDNTRLF